MLKSLVYPEKDFCISVLRNAHANIAICCPLVNQNVTVMIYHKYIRQFKVFFMSIASYPLVYFAPLVSFYV